MAVDFVTAQQGKGHVLSHQVAQLNAAIYGRGVYVAKGIGEECAAHMSTSNTLVIGEGLMLLNGREVIVDKDGWEFTIQTGTQGQSRIDVCCAHYSKADDGTESIEAYTLRGEPTTGEPVAPTAPAVGSTLYDGTATDALIPLYQVRIDGTIPGTPTPRFTLSTNLMNGLSGKANTQHNHSAANITSGTLAISRGGTGSSTAAGARFNLLKDTIESETAAADDSLFMMLPAARDSVVVRDGFNIWAWLKPKIDAAFGFNSSNVLAIAHGGTGAKTRAKAMDALTDLGINPIADGAADTLKSWQTLGAGVAWFNEDRMGDNKQPNKMGSLLNFPKPNVEVITQLYHAGTNGNMYYRGFDANGVNPWFMFLDDRNTRSRITAQGASGNWIYYRYSDGWVRQICRISTSMACGANWGNGFYNPTPVAPGAFPIPLKANTYPRVQGSVLSTEGRYLCTLDTTGTLTTAPKAYICSMHAQSAQSTVLFQLTVEGWAA